MTDTLELLKRIYKAVTEEPDDEMEYLIPNDCFLKLQAKIAELEAEPATPESTAYYEEQPDGSVTPVDPVDMGEPTAPSGFDADTLALSLAHSWEAEDISRDWKHPVQRTSALQIRFTEAINAGMAAQPTEDLGAVMEEYGIDVSEGMNGQWIAEHLQGHELRDTPREAVLALRDRLEEE